MILELEGVHGVASLRTALDRHLTSGFPAREVILRGKANARRGLRVVVRDTEAGDETYHGRAWVAYTHVPGQPPRPAGHGCWER